VFASALERSQGATLWLAIEGQAYSAKLSVRCGSVVDAVEIASKLMQITNVLRRMIESEEKKPNPADLSGMLTSGSFHNEGTRVLGTWPIPKALFDTLLGK
jgi:hypothetical protein